MERQQCSFVRFLRFLDTCLDALSETRTFVWRVSEPLTNLNNIWKNEHYTTTTRLDKISTLFQRSKRKCYQNFAQKIAKVQQFVGHFDGSLQGLLHFLARNAQIFQQISVKLFSLERCKKYANLVDLEKSCKMRLLSLS